jgi:hypothetical protein
MSISLYDPARFDREPAANVRGGLHRANSASRDILGRFEPANGHLPINPQHGVSGGRKRAATAKRDNNGRFIK